MIFAVVGMLTGSVLCDAGITAILSSIVNAMDASAGQASAWAQVVAKYVKNRSLPFDLEQKIFGYFIYMHLTEHNMDESAALADQPRAIKRKLLEDICFQGMKSFPTLAPYKPGFIKSACHCMVPYLALPTEILINKGSAADKIFLIVRGKVHVLSTVPNPAMTASDDDNDDALHKVVQTLENGSIIGDFKPNAYTYRTAEYSECYVLVLEAYIKCFSYVTKSGRSRQASKKKLADDFANVVIDVTTTYGDGFVMSEKKRRVTAVEAAATKLKGFVRRAEAAEPTAPRPGQGRERSKTVIGDNVIASMQSTPTRARGKIIVPVIE